MMKTDGAGMSTYQTTLCHNQRTTVQLRDASANAYRPAILTNSHSTDVNQIPRNLTLRRLMSYIYGAPILDVSRSHTTTQHSR